MLHIQNGAYSKSFLHMRGRRINEPNSDLKTWFTGKTLKGTKLHLSGDDSGGAGKGWNSFIILEHPLKHCTVVAHLTD